MNELMDYAMPLMQMEKANKRIHDLCLDRKYQEAIQILQNIRPMLIQLEVSLKVLQRKEESWK